MTKRITASELLNVVPARQQDQHLLQFRSPNGEQCELAFPSAQLFALIEASLKAEQGSVERADGTSKSPAALLAESFNLSLQPQTKTLLLHLRVGNQTFAFALLREHALRLVALMSRILPAY